ncbi:MAG: SDR family oxidoreductase [Minisyncoccia bacterium]|jgi:nucleoside-diphosphate-sugar epimerase
MKKTRRSKTRKTGKKPDKVVVTGGAGFIGSNLVEALIEEGYDVHVVDNLSAGKREHVHPRATLHIVDIRHKEDLLPIFGGSRYVFHLAALPRVQYSIENPVETHEVNITGTLNVLEAAREAGVERLIYSASSSAYGDQPKMPLREDMPALPKSPYGMQKHAGELYCRVWSEVHGLETVSLRYFNVYGPRQSEEGAYALVIAKFIKQKREGKPMTITGDGTQTRDFTHVVDVVRANILAAKSKKVGRGEVINIGGGRNISVKRIAELLGGPFVHIEPRLEPHDTLADYTKAKELLGWEPTIVIEEGIKGLM